MREVAERGSKAPRPGRQQRAPVGSHVQTVSSLLPAGLPRSQGAWHTVGAQAMLEGASLAE